jgi:hypothetical protein
MGALNLNQWIIKHNESAINKEISSIAVTLRIASDNALKKDALSIARSFLEINNCADPVTLARASFYLALKRAKMAPENKVKQIVHNNGSQNRWWVQLLPVLINHIGSE